MSLYERITRARELLELPERATLKQIRSNYRRLVRKWHPDRCTDDPEKSKEMTARIIDAHRVIMDYCNHYRYSFSREEAAKYLSPDEWWRERFGP
ncbi:MAG: J domain-containing protein [Deltaproteobacteria bacterium]|nr:J domain-containing protein [Deltaproteobacteria bacterium]